MPFRSVPCFATPGGVGYTRAAQVSLEDRVRRINHKAIAVDEQSYQRFSERNTAFNAVSRDLGENWEHRFAARQRRLVAEGKVSPKERLPASEDAFIHLAMGIGLDRINVLTANWGSGKPNRNALRWEPPADLVRQVGMTRPSDPAKLTRAVRLLAARCGAVHTGVAPFDPRWVYADTQRNHCAPDEPDTKPIRIADVQHPSEDEKALYIPKSIRYVVVFAVPMDREMIRTAPSMLAEAATSQGYSDAARVSLSVAEFIRTMGYNAIPSVNGTALNIPIAIQAGLGEAARNGLLITPEYGPSVRLSKVLTDMPLEPNQPIDLGIRAYCRACGECARACPAQAISRGEPTFRGYNECNNDAVKKWRINAKECLHYWLRAGSSCSACIAVCPFTQGRGWLGGLPQRVIARTARFNSAIAWLDQHLLNRGRRLTSEGFLG